MEMGLFHYKTQDFYNLEVFYTKRVVHCDKKTSILYLCLDTFSNTREKGNVEIIDQIFV
jgi:hypothetical protein